MSTKKLPQPLEFLSSHGLTVIALFCLMVLTVVGTIDQKYIGLFQSQKKYFESFLVKFHLFDTGGYSVFLPFPGGSTILSILFINLALAFAFKFRFRWQALGVWICHVGLFLLLVGSFVQYMYAKDGHVTFQEGEIANTFTSYHYLEFLVEANTPGKSTTAIAFPSTYLEAKKELVSGKYPFKIITKEYYLNCQALQSTQQNPSSTGQDFYLKRIKPEIENEQNRSGALVELIYQGNKIGKFFAVSEIPTFFNYNGKKYSLLLRKVKSRIPFALKLIKFTRELYPGTNTPKHYESKVIVIDEKSSREVLISMNRPLRYQDYTFYQSSFAISDGRKVSTLAVVKTPWQKWPHISCLLIALGMIIHFFPKLFRFIRSQQQS